MGLCKAQTQNMIVVYSIEKKVGITEQLYDQYLISDSKGAYYFEYTQNTKVPYSPININTYDFSTKSEDANVLYYKNLDSSKIYTTRYDFTKMKYYLLSDEYKINWKVIPNQKKKILNYECRLAVAEFRGRTWSAWFTNDIAISSGPWKLNGLSGLILEAKDDKDFYHFTAKDIVLNAKNEINTNVKSFFNENLTKAKPYLYWVEIENDILKNNLGLLKSLSGGNFPNDMKNQLRNYELEKSFEREKN